MVQTAIEPRVRVIPATRTEGAGNRTPPKEAGRSLLPRQHGQCRAA